MIDMDEIRKDIAIKYGYVLDKNDPTLVSGAIFDSALEQSLAALNAKQEANVKALINSIQKSHEETRRLAKKVVDEGTEYACDQIHTAIKETMRDSQEEFKKEVRKDWVIIQAAKQTAVIGAAVSASCAVLMVGAALVNVF